MLDDTAALHRRSDPVLDKASKPLSIWRGTGSFESILRTDHR
jgi:hypothetical protein